MYNSLHGFEFEEICAETVLNREFFLACQMTTNSLSSEIRVLESSMPAYLHTEYKSWVKLNNFVYESFYLKKYKVFDKGTLS